ncbi:MAG: hypothetical protein LAT84_06630 [Balneolia bacterium]|nr:hypothetical protein [Balneolia bacterium]
MKQNLSDALSELSDSMPVLRQEKVKKVLSLADQLTDTQEGIELLYEAIPKLHEAGAFSESMWENPEKLVPALVGGTLKAGGQTTVMEIMSELRMLAISEKRIKVSNFSDKLASRFLRFVIVANLDLIFPDASEELRELDTVTTRKITGLFSFLKEFLPLETIREDLAEEIDQICLQRPVITERALHILSTVRNELKLDNTHKADRKLLKYVNAAFSPTEKSRSSDPEAYAAYLENADEEELHAESGAIGSSMRDTGLSSEYHAVFLRNVRNRPVLLKRALGLDSSGRAELDKHREFVARLIEEVIHPETSRSCYGLARFLERALLSHQPVKSGLERLLTTTLHPEVSKNLRISRPKANLKPEQLLVAECLGILGQPLGIGQGWNPTCQSARGISLWSRHAPGKLLRLIETAAKTNNLTMRFEAYLLSSSELSAGLAKNFDYNLDAVSVVLVPHLDKIYNRMMELAALRGEDPHKWVNPAMYGHWIPVGFISAYDDASHSIKDYEKFLRTFYITHHPGYNGGHDLVYPNPVGIFLTGANGALLGFHAVSILRVAKYENEYRIYFLNPNNEGRQQWQSDIRPTVSGHGERVGESSLPFFQFASRLYAFHFNPSDMKDLNEVRKEEIDQVAEIAKNSWGVSYTWTAGTELGLTSLLH